MAVVKRLIDDRYLTSQMYLICEACQTDNIFIDAIIDEIDNAPDVDAVEVVHGRWEDMYDGKYVNPRFHCSVCKEKSLFKDERDVLGNWRQVQALTDYCPNCGADMRGDGNGT